MKTLIFLAIMVCIFISTSKQTFIESFTIGKYSYSVYKEEKFIHDDNMNAEYFVVYAKNNKSSICSSFMTAKRNDTLFTKGSYMHDQEKLEFKEYYFYQNARMLDSIIKIFYPNKKGYLILKQSIEYKDGKATRTEY